ncbi:hypothetical protein Tco_0032903 [Tanacetum coccineum]
MTLCTTLQNKVLDLEKTKTTQQNEIASLKRRVNKLEKKSRSRTHKLKRLYKVGLTARVEFSDNEESLGKDASKQGRIDVIDADEKIILVSVQNVDEEIFDVNVLDGEEVFVAEQEVAVKDVSNVVSTAGDATTVSAATTTTATITIVDDITLAQALMEIKSTKPKEKGLLYKSWLNIQQQNLHNYLHNNHKTKIDADYQLAKRLQAYEQEELSIEEKATLFQQLLETRRKHFAAKRAEEKRNKPPTKAQQKKIMCTYLKNMEEYKLKDLNLKEFNYIQEMFDRAFKRVNTFEDFKTKLVEDKEKRAGTELVQEISKKQKVEDDKETAELKYQMLKSFDMEDLEDLYKLVKAKYESTRPVEDLDLLLWALEEALVVLTFCLASHPSFIFERLFYVSVICILVCIISIRVQLGKNIPRIRKLLIDYNPNYVITGLNFVLDFALNITDHQLLRLLELNSWQLLRLLQAQSTDSTCGSLKDTPSYLYLEAAARHASWKSKNDIRRHGKNVTAINNYEIAHYCEEKNKSAALEEKLKEVIVEQDEMKKCMGLMMKEIQRLSKLVPDNYLGCLNHGFSELHQLDTFYNALNSIDQDSLNSAAGGNFLDKMPRECLKIIESKSKVRQSRNKAVVAKMSTSSSTLAISSDVAELKDMVRA